MKKKKPKQQNSSEFTFIAPHSLQHTLTMLKSMQTKSGFAREKRKITITPESEDSYHFQVSRRKNRTTPVVAKGYLSPESPNSTLVTGKVRIALWMWPFMLLQGIVFLALSLGLVYNNQMIGFVFVGAYLLIGISVVFSAPRYKTLLVQQIQQRLTTAPADDSDEDYFE